MSQRHNSAACTSLAALLVLASCSKKDKAGDALGLKELEPPVASTLPKGLNGSASLWEGVGLEEATCADLYTESCPKEKMVAYVKKAVFEGKEGCMGSASSDVQGRIRCRLNAVDSRSAELETRAKEFPRKCVKQTPVSQSLDFGITGAKFTGKYSCYDDLTSPDSSKEYKLLAGVEGSKAWIRETWVAAEGVSNRTALASIDTTTEAVEHVFATHRTFTTDTAKKSDSNYIVTTNSTLNGKAAVEIMWIQSDKQNKTFEFSYGASSNFLGISCGMQIKSAGGYIYAAGLSAPPGSATNETNCAEVATETSAPRWLEICLDGSTLAEVDSAKCASIKTFSLPKLRPASIKSDTIKTLLTTIDTTGLTDIDTKDE